MNFRLPRKEKKRQKKTETYNKSGELLYYTYSGKMSKEQIERERNSMIEYWASCGSKY